MDLNLAAERQGRDAQASGSLTSMDVVEIGLLLPANRMKALLDLARRRHETVGQVIREMIEVGLRQE